MNKIYKFSLLILSFSTIMFFTSRQALTKSNGSPLMNTGSPGDGSNNTCAKSGCHAGTINAFPGSVAIDVSGIPAGGYAPGETYTIGVTVAESGRNTFGFQATAENSTNSKMGDFIAGSGTRLEFTDWITHSVNSGTGTWSFSWKAPNSSDDITFYAAGNAANGNGNSIGDHIYTSSVTVSKDIFASVENLSDRYGIKVYNLFGERRLIIELEDKADFSIYNIKGQKVMSFSLDQGNSSFDLSKLNSGQYLVTEINTGYTNKIILR